MRMNSRAFAWVPVVILVGLLGGAIAVFPHAFPSLFGPKDHTDHLAAAQAQLKVEEAKEAALQAQLQAAQAVQKAADTSQVRYSQQMLAGADNSLSRAPAAARTQEVQLAASFITRANLGLAAAIGALPPEQQAAIIKIVDQSLSQVQAEQDQAKAALAAKDQELTAATAQKSAAIAQVGQLQAAQVKLQATITAAQATVDSKTKEVLSWVSQKDAADKKNSGLSALVTYFKRLVIAGLLLWAFCAILPIFLRGLPELGIVGTALHWLSQIAVAPGHALVSWLDSRQSEGPPIPVTVPFSVSNPPTKAP